MTRITNKDLQAVVDRINRVTGSPALPYVDGKAQIGCYHLSHAYGGVCVHRMHNEHGGVSTPIVHGHVHKRTLYELMHAWLRGRDSAQA